MGKILKLLEKGRLFPFITGVSLSLLAQSSTTALALLASMINTGVLTFSRSLGIMIGASLGTTLTTQILAFKLSNYSPYVLLLSYIVAHWFKGKWSLMGKLFWGVGLVFFGMLLMETSLSSFRESLPFVNISLPFYLFISGLLVTAVFQSSALTLGIIITMVSQGIIPLDASFWAILGAHLASSLTVILASLGMRREAQALAWFSLLYKVLGCVVIAFLCYPLCRLASGFSPARGVAILHLEIALLNAVILIPFLSPLSKVSFKLAFLKEELEELCEPIFLEESAIDFPEWACYLTMKEILRVGSFLEYGLLRAKRILMGEEGKLTALDTLSTYILRLTDEISLYLGRINGMVEERINMFTVLGDIKQANEILRSSVEGLLRDGFQMEALKRKDEIKSIMEGLSEMLETALGALALSDKLMARKVGRLKAKLEDRVRSLLMSEELLKKGVWLDFASFVRRFSDQCYYIAEAS